MAGIKKVGKSDSFGFLKKNGQKWVTFGHKIKTLLTCL